MRVTTPVPGTWHVGFAPKRWVYLFSLKGLNSQKAHVTAPRAVTNQPSHRLILPRDGLIIHPRTKKGNLCNPC